MFGAITHKKVVLLVDTSGSMEAHMHNLKKDFELLVWEQLFKLSIRLVMEMLTIVHFPVIVLI